MWGSRLWWTNGLSLDWSKEKKELDLNLNCWGQYDDKKSWKNRYRHLIKVIEPNNSSLNLIFFDFRNDQCHTKSERNNIKYILVNYKKHLIYIFFSWFSHGLWTSRCMYKKMFVLVWYKVYKRSGSFFFFSFFFNNGCLHFCIE